MAARVQVQPKETCNLLFINGHLYSLLRPLTTNIETINAGTNSTVNGTLAATGSTIQSFDQVLGNGQNVTFNINDSTAVAFALPPSLTLSGLSNVNVSRQSTGINTGAITITDTTFGTGVKTLNYTEASLAANMTAAAASVTLNSATSVAVKATSTGVFTTVAVTDTGTTASTRGSTLTTVTIQGSTGAATLNDNAINTLNLAGAATGDTVTVNAAAGTRALTINYTGTTGSGAVTDAQATSVIMNVSGAQTAGLVTAAKAASFTINTTAAATTSINGAIATTLNLTGTKSNALTVTAPALTSVVVTGAGGVSADVSAITTLATVDTTGSTAIAATATNGLTGTIANNFTLNTTTTFTGGAGDDQITVGATTKALTLGAGTNQATVSVTALGTGGSIDGGTGTADVLVLTNANAAAITATAATAAAFKAAVTGFEVLDAGTADATTISLSSFGTFNKLKLVTAAVTQTLSGVASGTTLELTRTGGTGALTSLTTNTLGGASDVINVRLADDLSAAPLAFGTVTLPGVETVNITTVDSAATFTARLATLTVVDTNATTINISGNNGVALTHAGTALQTFNASGVTTGAVTFTSAALTNNVVVTGSATGSDVLNFGSATGTVTITAGNGGGTFTGATAAVVNTITGGNGTDIIIGGAGADILGGGAGTDTITGLAGKDVITGGSGVDAIRYTTKATSVGAAGANVDTVVGFVAGTDKIQLQTGGGAGALLTGVELAGGAAVAAMGAVVTSATNVDTLTQVYTALGTSLAAMAASAANGTATVAQVVTFTSGTAAGTYLVVNDATVGFNGANDLVINITGVSGTVSAGDFSFAA